MNALKFTSPAAPKGTAGRPRWALVATTAILSLFVLGAAAGCSKQAASDSQTRGPASASDPVVAKVNGTEIRESDLAFAEDDIGQELQQAPPDVRREQLITYLADIILVSQTPDAKKAIDTDDFKQRMAFFRNKLMMGAALSQVGKAATTDDALQQVYNDAVKTQGGQEEVHARHILVETEDEAKAIKQQIDGGADFAALAKEKSKDPGAADGGDLGYFTKDQMVPEFSDVAFKMFAGQVSNPVKTQFGWHIIKVEDKRTRPAPSFEMVKGQIEAFVARKAQSDYVAKLRQTAKIERLDTPITPGGAMQLPPGHPSMPSPETATPPASDPVAAPGAAPAAPDAPAAKQ